MAKDNFIFYRQWWESIRELAPEQQSRAYDALMRFVFENDESADPVSRAVIATMRSTIIRDREKYERVCERNRANGTKGGAPKGNNNARKSESETTQNNPKQPKTTHSVVLPESMPDTPEPPTETEHRKISQKTENCDMSAADAERMFDDFRRLYPGKKRGLKPEFDNFKRKAGTHYRDIVPLLIPAVERMVAWTERKQSVDGWSPAYKNLQTWINNQCWTDEYPEINTPDTRPASAPQPTQPNYDTDDDFGGVNY